MQIKNVLLCGNKGNYEFDYSSMPIESVDKHYHLWTIEDAKDGDVLVNWNNTTFIFKAIEDETVKFHIAYNEKWDAIKTPSTKISHLGFPEPQFEFHLATKEQRDLLFRKMDEAGYEWDAEKKELKVKPKFKVGDWLVHNERKHIVKVVNATPMVYEVVNILGYHHTITDTAIENNYHLWTLEDAKDGDVLACKDELILFKSYDNKNLCYYCWYNGQTNNFFPKDTHTSRPRLDIIVPATKEQRDTFFTKMKEEGYEWDVKNQVMTKIEQKSIDSYCQENCKGFQETGKCFANGECKAKREAEQELTDLNEFINELSKQFPDVSFAKLSRIVVRVAKWAKSNDEEKSKVQPKQEWSEEDKKIMNGIIDSLTRISLNTRTDSTSPNYTFYKEIDWLKSLRPQNAYNPYKAVVESIAEMCKHYDKASHSGLRDFYDNVKVKCKDAQEYDKMFPQNHWKPSNEQMMALLYHCSNGSVLSSLYNDLNKLKEE